MSKGLGGPVTAVSLRQWHLRLVNERPPCIFPSQECSKNSEYSYGYSIDYTRVSTEARPKNGTPGDQGGLTLASVSTPRSVKEEGGSSSRPVLAVGGSFRPGGLSRAPGWGRVLLGISAGWAMPRQCSLSASGLSREKAGVGQAVVS